MDISNRIASRESTAVRSSALQPQPKRPAEHATPRRRIDFGVAQRVRGTVTSASMTPIREESRDVTRSCAIVVGIEWGGTLQRLDYFEQLINGRSSIRGEGVLRQPDADQMREYRGTLPSHGPRQPIAIDVEENRPAAGMRAGEFEDGAHVLGRDRTCVRQQKMRIGDCTESQDAPSAEGDAGASIRCTTGLTAGDYIEHVSIPCARIEDTVLCTMVSDALRIQLPRQRQMVPHASMKLHGDEQRMLSSSSKEGTWVGGDYKNADDCRLRGAATRPKPFATSATHRASLAREQWSNRNRARDLRI